MRQHEIDELFRQALACEACGGVGAIWPKQGYARTCEACEAIRATIREHHDLLATMDLDTRPGARVVFAHPTNGYSGDVHRARMLTIGAEYTVARVSVGDSSSTVELVEFPGELFNTVQFQNMDEPAETSEAPVELITREQFDVEARAIEAHLPLLQKLREKAREGDHGPLQVVGSDPHALLHESRGDGECAPVRPHRQADQGGSMSPVLSSVEGRTA